MAAFWVSLYKALAIKEGDDFVPKNVQELVSKLKSAVAQEQLSGTVISEAIDTLKRLGHKTYDSNKFPQLENTSSFDVGVGSTPATLAEALLWKLGKWPTYKTFVENYQTKDLEVSTRGGIVFSAFAKHLQNYEFPVYDQHAIRAIWAICQLEANEQSLCKALLLDRSGAWKQSGSGDDGSCYKLFVHNVEQICKQNGVTHRDLDLLLMPLGQTLKKETRTKKKDGDTESDFQRFETLCVDGNG